VHFGTQLGQPLFRLIDSVTLERRAGKPDEERIPGEGRQGKETRVVRSRFRFGLLFSTGLMDRLPKSQLSTKARGSEVLVIEIPGRDAQRCVRRLVDTARVNLQKLRNITLKLSAGLQAAILLQMLNTD
jgi:hypothetical protein